MNIQSNDKVNERKNDRKEYLCNNCGTIGHIYYHCKRPITSLGIICYRFNPTINKNEFLLVQRKDSLGYVDFLRGKYSEQNEYQLKNIIQEMTKTEIENILNFSYKELWDRFWNNINEKHDLKNEDKFNNIKRFKSYLFNNINNWEEPEWGFPKGRRSNRELDIECAVREFEEETGYSIKYVQMIKNLNSFEEIFTGSNLKSYKHKYFLAKMNYQHSLNDTMFQKSEIGNMKWFDIETAISKIRPYNIEKIEILQNIHQLLEQTIIF
jgi:8-oxo-dGTP pyrophosphatase MutT (NUDIX family)